MTFAPKSASALAVVFAATLALAACGGGAEEADEPAGNATPEAAATAAPADGATPAPADTPAPSPTPSGSPSPTPSPTATPSPAATTAAVTAPPMFAMCAACHSVTRGEHGIGPSLAGVSGRRAGTIAGFEYSQAMKDSGLTWNDATLNRYLADPKGVVPGTTMAYNGIKDAAQRQAVVNYLKSL